MHRLLPFLLLTLVAVGPGGPTPVAPARAASPDPLVEAQVALFDPGNGRWHIREPGGGSTEFFYGMPGDIPLLGDWDGDGLDTVGAFRPSNGFFYLRNSNDCCDGDVSFWFGVGGDVPLVGDWDGDGYDTVGVYRRGKVFLRNSLTTGEADEGFYFGDPGDKPFTGDFDGDEATEIGLHRESSGFVYLLAGIPVGEIGQTLDEFYYGNPGDRIVAGDWDANGTETVGIFRPADTRFYLSNQNETSEANEEFGFGETDWLPVAGYLTTPAGPGPLRIMPIGDSITQGQGGWHTYRCYLADALSDAGLDFDFVGNVDGPLGGGNSGCPQPFDEDHEALWGFRADQMIPQVSSAALVHRPDVALIHLGTNDVLQFQSNSSTREELRTIINDLRSANPDVVILLARVIPCDPVGGDPAFGTRCSVDIPNLNGEISALAAGESTARSPVITVNMHSGFSLSWLRDHVHPDPRGDQFMADRWMAALQDAGLI